MTEYIDKKPFLDKLLYMGYFDGDDEIKEVADSFTTIDVIERSKIDKAMSEIKALAPTPTKIDVEEGNPILNAVYETIYDVLEIIKRNIGE